MVASRRRFKQLTTLEDRLMAWAGKVREQADRLKAGPARDALLKKVSQAETAARMNTWASASELKPPK